MSQRGFFQVLKQNFDLFSGQHCHTCKQGLTDCLAHVFAPEWCTTLTEHHWETNVSSDSGLRFTAAHCNMLQHTATRTATHCNTLQPMCQTLVSGWCFENIVHQLGILPINSLHKKKTASMCGVQLAPGTIHSTDTDTHTHTHTHTHTS